MEDLETRPTKAPPQIGSYRLIQQLGSGGMSSVFRAVHVETGHEVALKVLPRSMAKNSVLLQRFHREAKNAEALTHPNIAEIYDRGSDQGRHYLVLEYVDGSDLHERVRNNGPLSVEESLRIVRAVSEGLKYASGQGVIHRDIKPANLLTTSDGRVKIIDLGLALQTESEDERVTRDGTTVGTVDYMSPEQARDSRAISEQSDMYSLGCTFYYLLSGKAPFPGGDVADKLSRHCTMAPPDVRDLRPEVPERLARLIQKLMAKRPERRFDDYDQLIRALDSIEIKPTSGPAPEVLTALIDDEDDDDEPWPELTASQPRAKAPARTPATPEPEISFAELAAIDRETPSIRGPRRPVPVEVSAPYAELVPLDEDDDFNDDAAPLAAMLDGPSYAPRTVRRASHEEWSFQTWVLIGAFAGLSIVIVVLGISFIIELTAGSTEPDYRIIKSVEP